MCVTGAEMAHVDLDEGQWALGALAPEPWESKVPMRLFCSYTTRYKNTRSHVLLSRCNSKIIALNCGAFQFLKWLKKVMFPPCFLISTESSL